MDSCLYIAAALFLAAGYVWVRCAIHICKQTVGPRVPSEIERLARTLCHQISEHSVIMEYCPTCAGTVKALVKLLDTKAERRSQ